MTASVFARPHPQAAAIAGINITPLVDVMLVLLVIFMVTMPIRSESIGLTLPGVAPPIPRPEPVQLQVQADGSALLDGVRVELSALTAELRAQHAQAPKATLSLDGSGEAEYRAFAFALAAARNAGYRDIAIRR